MSQHPIKKDWQLSAKLRCADLLGEQLKSSFAKTDTSVFFKLYDFFIGFSN